MKTRAWIGAAGAALFAAPLALAQPQLEPPRPAPAPTPSVAPAPTPPPAATPTTTDAAPDATPAATPPTTPPPPPSGEPRAPRADPFWQTRYEEAKTKLLVGEFAEAAEMLKSLEETAPTESDRRLAREQRALALEWANRGLVFVKRSDLGESTLSPKALDRRTTDELAQLYTSAFFYGVGTGGWIAALTKP
jgi:type IV secretory pathway VirB10-like protein